MAQSAVDGNSVGVANKEGDKLLGDSMPIDWATVIASGFAAFAGGAASYAVAWANSSIQISRVRVQELATRWNSDRFVEIRNCSSELLTAYIDKNSDRGSFDEFLQYCKLQKKDDDFLILMHYFEYAALLRQQGMMHNAEASIILGRYFDWWHTRIRSIPPKENSEWRPLWNNVVRTDWR